MTDFVKRKLTRGDCLKEVRPCRRHCPYRLDGEESCALDVADRGGMKQADVAKLIGVSWSRIQQIEDQALAKVCEALGRPMPARSDYLPDLDLTRIRIDLEALGDEIVEAVAKGGTITADAICETVGHKRNTIRDLLATLVSDGRLLRVRRATPQEAYLYRAPESEAAE